MNTILKEGTSDSAGRRFHYYFDGNEWVGKWEENMEACEMVMTNQEEELTPIRNQVLAGEASPLAFHIHSRFFDIGLLSSYTGIPKRLVKKHLKPDKFNQLEREILEKYASALGISVEELKKV